MRVYLIFIIIVLQNSLLFSQRGLLKRVLVEETHVVSSLAKNTAHEIHPALKGVKTSAKNIEGHRGSLSKFWNTYKEDLKEVGEEILSTAMEEGVEVAQQVYEILNNPKYPELYKAICKKAKCESISTKDIILLLVGQKVMAIQIEDIKLYRIYFLMSNTFAKKELEQLLTVNNCESEPTENIKSYAAERKISLNLDLCEEITHKLKEEEKSNLIIGLVFFACIGILIIYFFYRKVRKRMKK